jgi:hypothetical protein
MSDQFHKVVRIGRGPSGDVFCKIEVTEGRLSISGVEGPKRNGDARGSAGQIEMHEWNISEYAPGWNAELEQRFRAVWKGWHLNDMRAGCEHQRAEGWDKRPIYADKPTTAYVDHPGGGKGWNMLTWLPEGRGGLLGKACPTCGYRYGTQWLSEDLPAGVVEFLRGLPDTDKQPAWV